MIITCEACGTSFKLKTSLVKETGSTVRCSKCQHVFIVYPASAGVEKPAFTLDESLEAKIDDVLGDEFDDDLSDVESEISLETAEISMTASDEKVPGGTFEDEFSDFESEVALETAEISMATSEDLFDSTASLLDALEEGAEEPEILMSDLLQEDDMISMDDLVSGKTSEAIDMNDLLAKNGDSGSDIMSFEDFSSKTIEETEDDDSSALIEDADESDIVSLSDIEKAEETAQDEEIVAFDDLESEEAFEKPVAEAPSDEERIDFIDFDDSNEIGGKTEPEQVLVKTEGGVDANLNEFDVTKEPEKEKPAKKAEKPVPEKEAKADDLGLDLDFGIDEPDAVSDSEKTGAEAEAFEMDLDLDKDMGPEDKKEAADEEDFDLDFDLDAEETPVAKEKKEAKADDLDLDLEGFEDLDLTEASSDASIEDDLGLDLDEFDNLDLEEDLEKEPAVAREETMEDFDLDFDLDDKSKHPSAAKAEKDDFDLDFDLDAEAPGKAATAEDEFSLDLDIAPEAVEAKEDTGDFELDLDDAFEDKTMTVSEMLIDETTGHKSEELDLTQIEDVLDFDESPRPKPIKAGATAKTVEPEMEETELYTASNEDEMNIDLETMLDEEEAADKDQKEVSLETVEQREKQAEKQYRKTVIEEEPAPEEVSEDLSREFEDAFKPAAPAIMARMPEKEKSRSLKKIWVGVLLLIIIGTIGFIGWKMLGGKVETPSAPPAVKEQVKDMGNLQMEMIATPAYKFVENKTSGELLIITGNVTNRYDHPRSNVQVKGTLYNNAGKVIISSAVYCGNMFTDEELTDLDMKTIEGRLNNRMGDNQSNSGVKPGQSVPFTVIFKNLPADMGEFTIEVTASAK
ncbi:MAG: zinc-ribbon domain-containing protein [Desulfobacteraceae bacterium]|nr:zinc-ribbon domain-containing protein [Desulfobacteraceae bacterium]